MLDKADGETDAKYRSVVKAKWDEWKADKDANALQVRVEPEPTYIVTEEGDGIVTEKGDPIVTEDDFFRLSHVGCEDKEGRDVVAEAIEWWRKQLDEIEAQVSL